MAAPALTATPARALIGRDADSCMAAFGAQGAIPASFCPSWYAGGTTQVSCSSFSSQAQRVDVTSPLPPIPVSLSTDAALNDTANQPRPPERVRRQQLLAHLVRVHGRWHGQHRRSGRPDSRRRHRLPDQLPHHNSNRDRDRDRGSCDDHSIARRTAGPLLVA